MLTETSICKRYHLHPVRLHSKKNTCKGILTILMCRVKETTKLMRYVNKVITKTRKTKWVIYITPACNANSGDTCRHVLLQQRKCICIVFKYVYAKQNILKYTLTEICC